MTANEAIVMLENVEAIDTPWSANPAITHAQAVNVMLECLYKRPNGQGELPKLLEKNVRKAARP